MRWLRFKNLRVRLVLLVLIAIIPALGLAIYNLAQQLKRASSIAEQEVLHFVRIVDDDYSRLIEKTRQLLMVLSHVPAMRGEDPAACSSFLATIMKDHPEYSNMGTVKANGEKFCSALPASPSNVAQRPWFQRTVKSPGFAIGDYQIGSVSGKANVNYVYPLHDEAGNAEVLIYAGLDVAWLNQLAAKAHLPEGWILTVRDHNGVILARHPDSDQWMGKIIPEAPIMEVISTRQEGTTRIRGIDGVERIYAFTRLHWDSEGGRIYLSVGLPTSIAFADAYRNLAFNLVCLGIVAVFALAGVWLGSDWLIMRGVNALVEATKRLCAGDLSVRAAHSQEDEELGHLANAFDQMAESLEIQDSERRRAEEALKSKTAEQELLLDHIDIQIWYLTDIETYGAVNRATAEFLGLKKEDLEYRSLRELLSEEEAQVCIAGNTKVFEKKRGIRTEEWRRNSQGDACLLSVIRTPKLNDSGEVDYVVCVARDITERKQAEDALRESEASYRTLARNLPGIVYRVFAQEDWRMQFFNNMLEEQTGFSFDELTKGEVCPLDPLILPEDRDLAVHTVKHAIEQNQSFEVEYQFGHKDGSVRYCMERGRPVYGSDGRLLYIDGVILDLTDRKRLESQLLQSQKLEAIGTLAGGIAHDFNNILGTILASTEMAKEDIGQESIAQPHLDRVLTASYRARDLVKQILSFSRRSQQKRIPVHICPIVEEALKLLRASVPVTIEMRQDISVPPVSKSDLVLADPIQIQQVVMNLCTNAVHAMREKGGVMHVSLKDMDGNVVPHHPNLSPGAYLQLSVSDTGHGLDTSKGGIKERIFDPFFTTKKVGEGTGMGLAVAHGIVTSSGGAIMVDSQPGKGASFHVFLPRLAFVPNDSLEPTAMESAPSTSSLGGKERILLVEDETDLALMWEHILRGVGYQITTRKSSVEALKDFSENPDHFDLVITDQTMSQMTGVDLAGKILRIRPDVRIILCTGFSEAITEEQAQTMGIRKFLLKPVGKRELLEVVRELLDEGCSG